MPAKGPSRGRVGLGLALVLSAAFLGGAGFVHGRQESPDSIDKYRVAAEHGEADAQLTLGARYAIGEGVPKDASEAVRWYRKAAEQGNAGAQFLLGGQYEKGEGVPKDVSEALRWYGKAAEQGNVSAQVLLGTHHSQGEGVPKDAAEAVNWYRKAAEQGHPGAQFLLGLAYSGGDGVPKDNLEAVKWYRKAAAQGDADAQVLLGIQYSEGEGVPKDVSEALKWYRLAAEQGDATAQSNLGFLYMSGAGVEKDLVEAAKWCRKAAEQGSELGRHNLGVMFLKGVDVPKDGDEAWAWYGKIANYHLFLPVLIPFIGGFAGRFAPRGELRKRRAQFVGALSGLAAVLAVTFLYLWIAPVVENVFEVDPAIHEILAVGKRGFWAAALLLIPFFLRRRVFLGALTAAVAVAGYAAGRHAERADMSKRGISESEILRERLKKEVWLNPRAIHSRAVLLAFLGYGYILLALALSVYLLWGQGKDLFSDILANINGAHKSVQWLKFEGQTFVASLVSVIYVVRTLWVRIPPPKGLALSRRIAPELWTLVDELQRTLRTPGIHEILLTMEPNAQVSQIPRLGILGWHKNYLVLGWPLMEALDPDQFRAVLAHELGHLSRNHSRLSNWIFRFRKTWRTLCDAFEAGTISLGGHRQAMDFMDKLILGWFLRWHAPLFFAHSSAMAQGHEFEADRSAASIAGARNLALSLLRLEAVQGYLEEIFWPDVWRRAMRVFVAPAGELRKAVKEFYLAPAPSDVPEEAGPHESVRSDSGASGEDAAPVPGSVLPPPLGEGGRGVSTGLLSRVPFFLRRLFTRDRLSAAKSLGDGLDCSVFSPTEAVPGMSLLVQAFVHLPQMEDEARAKALAADPEAKGRGSSILGTKIQLGSRLTFEFRMEDFDVVEPIQHVVWRGRTDSAAFDVRTPKDSGQRNAIGRLLVSQNSVPIGKVQFVVKILAGAKSCDIEPKRTGTAQRYCRAFVSYATKDRPEVLRRVQMLSAVGIQYFQDVMDLAPGARWSDELYRRIDDSDAMFLFWSTAARESEWVSKEWRYALGKKGLDFIHPVILEGPPVPPPPSELSPLHFNDKVLYFMQQ